jgi:hypothetical protein
MDNEGLGRLIEPLAFAPVQLYLERRAALIEIRLGPELEENVAPGFEGNVLWTRFE